MTDRRSVAVTGVLAALFACLVGCGDDVSNATANASASKGTQRTQTSVGHGDRATLPPTVQIDGMSKIPIWPKGGLNVIVVSGERSIHLECPEETGSILPIVSSGPNDKRGSLVMGENTIMPGERKAMRWKSKAGWDPYYFEFMSIDPGVIAWKGNTYPKRRIDEIEKLKVGKVLYWEEHRSPSKQLVGFDLAFEFYDDQLLQSFPLHSQYGMIRWTPQMDLSLDKVHDIEGWVGSGDRPRLIHNEFITSAPGEDIVRPGRRRVECAIQYSLEDDATVVYVSMRCWPDPMPVNLMCIEIDAFGSLNEGEDEEENLATVQVYLPKSPFKAEGFELPEFQEAAQSE
jgi:hypothetical protein